MTETTNIFEDEFNLSEAIAVTRDRGYHFDSLVLSELTRAALAKEIEMLPLEIEARVAKPIREGEPSEVKQRHKRFYAEYGSPLTPEANLVVGCLTKLVQAMPEFEELRSWQPNEIGYQQYSENDYIGKHRDRSSDSLLSVTFTLTGEAVVRIYEPLGGYRDYTNVKQIDEFRTNPGSVMLLRAPGLGNGEQVIHEVLPPLGIRSILNLRARPTVLGQPE